MYVQTGAVGKDRLIDDSIRASLAFKSGATATMVGSFVADEFVANLKVTGTNGFVAVDNFLVPHMGNKLTIRLGGTSAEATEEAVGGPFPSGIPFTQLLSAEPHL